MQRVGSIRDSSGYESQVRNKSTIKESMLFCSFIQSVGCFLFLITGGGDFSVDECEAEKSFGIENVKCMY